MGFLALFQHYLGGGEFLSAPRCGILWFGYICGSAFLGRSVSVYLGLARLLGLD